MRIFGEGVIVPAKTCIKCGISSQKEDFAEYRITPLYDKQKNEFTLRHQAKYIYVCEPCFTRFMIRNLKIKTKIYS